MITRREAVKLLALTAALGLCTHVVRTQHKGVLVSYKLGLKPVLEQPRVRLCDYYRGDLASVDSLKFPIGHAAAIKPEMFCNDKWGCCAESGSIEEVRLANALRGVTVNFDDASVERNYHEITGFDPSNPSTDGGTDIHDLFEYRKTTGMVDADGNRHKVVAYAGLTPGDFDELLVALSLFDMVGIGVNLPDYAQAQFAAGHPWHVLSGRHSIEGGHYIPVVGATDRDTAQLYTWGALAGITSPFYNTFNTVAVVALTEEMFTSGKSPEGIDFQQLATDLNLFNTGPVMVEAPKKKAA